MTEEEEPGIDSAGSTAQDEAYAALRRAITAGIFRPGEKLTVRKVSREIGYSTTPVRYALRRLCAAGGLEFVAGRSAQVPKLEAVDFEQLFDVIAELEEACFERIKLNSWDLDTSTLKTSRDRYEKAVASNDQATARYEVASFWRGYYALAKSSAFSSILDSIWLKLGPPMALEVLVADDCPDSLHSLRLRTFDAVISGLEQRDEQLINEYLDRMMEFHRKWYPGLQQ